MPAASEPNLEAAARQLRAMLNIVRDPLFAVLDGAHFDDLEDELADLGISSRSLFLKGGDEAMRRDGPWLVSLADGRVRAHIEELAVEKPCAVFWSCPDGEQALWRHLRSINEAMIPDDRIPGNDGNAGQPVKYERVLFRHWDPNVLGNLLPLLDAQQFARIFGPATAILMNATDYGGLKRAPRQNNLPPMPKGPLKVDLEQIDDLRKDTGPVYKKIKSSIMEKFPDTDYNRMSEVVDYCESEGIERHENIAFLVSASSSGSSFVKNKTLNPYLESPSIFSSDQKINLLRALMPKEL